MADALALGASAARHEGSNPSLPTHYMTPNDSSIETIKRTEKTLYLMALVTAPFVVYLNYKNLIPVKGASMFLFYWDFVVGELGKWGNDIVSLAYVGLIIFLMVGLIRVSTGKKSFDGRLSKKHLKEEMSEFLRELAWGIRITIPILLNLFLISFIIEYINIVNYPRLIDQKVASADFWFAGAYPFLKMGVLNIPDWLTRLIEFSFSNLTPLTVLGAVLIFLKDKETFSKYAVSFFLVTFMMMPIWVAVPVLSPQDRFLDNVYDMMIPTAEMKAELSAYDRSGPTSNFLEMIRESKKNLDIMPSTTFPSAHAAWAAVELYFLIQTSWAVAAVFAPFLILSTFGTFYLAQHYFVDAPAGILIGIVSVLLINLLFKSKIQMSNVKPNPND